MKAIGQINITDELTLLNPTMDILKVNYDWANNTVDVELIFMEGAFKHCRTFKFSTDGSGELTTIDILNFIKNHNVLKAFN